MVEIFGTVPKPMQIFLAILTSIRAKEIKDVTELFYLKDRVESYRKTGFS